MRFVGVVTLHLHVMYVHDEFNRINSSIAHAYITMMGACICVCVCFFFFSLTYTSNYKSDDVFRYTICGSLLHSNICLHSVGVDVI